MVKIREVYDFILSQVQFIKSCVIHESTKFSLHPHLLRTRVQRRERTLVEGRICGWQSESKANNNQSKMFFRKLNLHSQIRRSHESLGLHKLITAYFVIKIDHLRSKVLNLIFLLTFVFLGNGDVKCDKHLWLQQPVSFHSTEERKCVADRIAIAVGIQNHQSDDAEENAKSQVTFC